MADASQLVGSGRPRELFAEWVREARAEALPPPSDLAAAYLVDLLDAQTEAVAPAEGTLAEALLKARGAAGGARLAGLRAVGDRALFVAGFFGPSLTRRVVGIDYYREIGRTAYDEVARSLGERSFRALYGELAERFAACLQVLARVADRARPSPLADLLHLHERWLATGDPAARRALQARGCLVGDRLRRIQ